MIKKSFAIPSSSTRAENYPSHPIRIIVPAPSGGGSDTSARKLGEKLTLSLKQPIIIENRPGAAGNIAAELVAKAKPDGYTLLYGHNGILCINPWVYPSLPYDATKDLVPVTQTGRIHAIVVVNLSVPVRSLVDLIALARAKPGQLTYGSAGSGSPQHVTGELFKMLTGVNMLRVPYKGSAPVMLALLSKEIDLGFEYPVVVTLQVQAGQIRALAIAAPKRLASLPDVPTAAEAGLQDFESEAWVVSSHLPGRRARSSPSCIGRSPGSRQARNTWSSRRKTGSR